MSENIQSGFGLPALLFVVLLYSSAANAMSATSSPASCSNVTGVGTQDWSNPNQAISSDTNYATASVNDNQTTRYLKCTGYSFAIPANATINGITVNVERSSSGTLTRDAAMLLVKADVITGADRSTSTNYTTSNVIEAHGGAADLWGTTWTPSDINSAVFGAAFAAQKAGTSGGARTVSVDHVEITVDYSLPVACTPPSNIPAGVSVTCQCDTFNRAVLNPSTIFGANWIVSASDTTGILPSIVNSGYLRLTNNSGNNAKAATVPGIFPAAGNYISVEFRHYAYNGSGADGIAVTLSDYSVPAVPGAYGGSLGYAQETGIHDGFAGGWIGVGIDEYGNYQNPTEGRLGGPGFIVESVGMRSSGSGMTGYRWLGGTASLNPIIDNRGSTTASPGYFYQVVVDARNAAATAVAVNRDTSGTGTSYSQLIGTTNVFATATGLGFTQAAVPANWQISFTGSTGGSTNIHEIGSLRICAQTIVPPSGGTASGFSAIDEAYPAAPAVPSYQNFQTGHIFMKLPATSFKLWVAALTGTGISSTYSTAAAKYVQVKLIDNSTLVCGSDAARTCNSTCTNTAAAEAGATQIVPFAMGGPGASLSPSFTLNSSWKNLVAVMKECTTSACTAFTATTSACSVDSFSVRPTSFASVTSSNATNVTTTGTPIFKAGSDSFALTATTTGVAGSASGYTGIPKINSVSVTAYSPAVQAGAVAGTFSAATSGTPSSTATGTTFTYSEVGAFYLRAPDFAVARIPGVYDDTWTATDSDPLKNDCVTGTAATAYANAKDANGKYGCNFGITADTAAFGRFVPDHFDMIIVPAAGVPMTCPSGLTCPALNATIPLVTGMVYSGQAFTTQVTARNAAGAPTINYNGALAKNVTLSAWDALGGASNIGLGGVGSVGSLSGNAVLASAFSAGVATTSTPVYIFTTTPTAPTNIYMRAQDTDNVTSLRATPSNSAEAGVTVVSGRIKVSNAYGSEMLPLTLTATAQYYTASGWGNSITDSITNLVLLPAYDVKKGATTTGTTAVTLTPASSTLFAGKLSIRLAPPTGGATGIATVTPASPAYLPLTSGTGTFGVYKGNNNFIYQREAY